MSVHFFVFILILLARQSISDLPPGYQQLSAEQKLNILWSKVLANPYSLADLPTDGAGILGIAKLLRPSYDAISFSHASDELPKGRKKVIHLHGSAAKVELRIFRNSTYTGLFQSGGIGIARLSLAAQDPKNFLPGMSLKVLVDGQRSQNFQVMYSLDGQGTNRNFFQNGLKNVFPDSSSFAKRVVSRIFTAGTNQLPGDPKDRPEAATNLGLYEQASVTSDGSQVTGVTAPYYIEFVPNPQVGWSPESRRDLRVNLSVIPPGSLLYTVLVKRTMNSPSEIIGQLVTTSEFVASEYEDRTLFFQHAAKRWRA